MARRPHQWEMERTRGPSNDQSEPRDTFNIAYVIHFVLGAGNLLPWNVLVTAVDYFAHLYPDEHVIKVFAVAYMISSLPVLVLLLSSGSWCKRQSFRLRMNLGLSMFVLSLVTVPLLDWTCQSKKTHRTFAVTVVAVAICGLADGLIGGSLVGSTGMLPKRYMQAVFAGTASSGVLVCAMRIVTKASLPQTPHGLRVSAHLYFVVSTLILLGCIFCCNILDKLPVMQKYQCRRIIGPRALNPNFPDNLHSSMRRFFEVNEQEKPILWEVTRKIRWPAFGILIIYTITLSIFPGYITENVNSKFLGDWYHILLITLYNVSDLGGKSLTALYVPKTIGSSTWACISRLLFYPLYTACLHGPKQLRTEVPVVFLTCMLGLSNGYLTSVLMILAPKSVLIAEAETAGIVMALFLVIGLVTGSITGWFWII